ncbi:MAG TPA: hypothetical protein PKA05_21540 [Roseiflexaceae bacterium]|nr:hypothetical protein [Roseiflexaceae bacterium]
MNSFLSPALRRFGVAAWCDIRLQWRNGFYAATAVMPAVMVGLVLQLPVSLPIVLLPVLVAGNLLITTFYFIAGLVLLERSDGSDAALQVSPLRTTEYLAAKVATLGILALAENLLLVRAAFVGEINPGLLIGGILVAAVLYTMVGAVAVARYQSLNEYLLPSMVIVSLLTLPLLPAALGWQHPLLLLHPLQPAMSLLRASIEPVAAWEIGYAVVAGIGWAALAAWGAVRSIRRG